MTRWTTFLLGSAIVLGAVLLAAGSASAAPVGEIAKSSKNCKGQIAYLVSGKKCMRTGQKCKRSRKADYKRWGWKCQKKTTKRKGSKRRKTRHVLARASLSTQRGRRAVIVGANGRVSKSMALQAFSQTVSRLPGVKHRKGAVGRIRSASGPIRWLSRHRSKLTRAQRKVLDRFYGSALSRTSATPRVDGQTVAKYGTMVEAAHARIATHMGYRLPKSFALEFPAKSENFAANRATDWDPQRWDFVAPPNARGCTIEFSPEFLAAPEATQRLVAAHEVFHCYQLNLASSAAEHFSRPAWLIEGGATWVGSSIADQWTGPTPESYWKAWITAPWLPPEERAYDAIGFFARLGETGVGDVWQLMGSLFKQKVGNEYDAAVNAAGETYLSWAAQGFAREPDWGQLWDVRGPGLAGQAFKTPRVSVPAITAGRSQALWGPRRANQLYKVNLDAPVIEIGGAAFGRYRLSDGSQGELTPGTYCTTRNACYCPQIAKGKAVFAISGVKGEAKIRVSGRSIKSAGCDKPKSRLSVTGPVEHTFTEPAVCGDYFGGGYEMVLSEAVGDGLFVVRMIIGEDDGFHGAGAYTFLGGTVFDPFVELASSKGSWGTDQGEEEQVMGTAFLEAGLGSGSLSVQMLARPGGSGTATVSGTFRCGTG